MTIKKFICFEGNEQFLHIQKYLLSLGKSFPTRRVYTSLQEFKKRNCEPPDINYGTFFVFEDDFTCNLREDIDYIKSVYPQVPYITYKNMFNLLEIE